MFLHWIAKILHVLV